MPLTQQPAAHTISQRIRTLKKIPPELIPLGMFSDPRGLMPRKSANTVACRYCLGVSLHRSTTALETGSNQTSSIAIFAAFYSIFRKLYVDGTLRLYRSRGHNQASAPEHTKP